MSDGPLPDGIPAKVSFLQDFYRYEKASARHTPGPDNASIGHAFGNEIPNCTQHDAGSCPIF
jgi:hypothetical protein